MTTNGFLLTRYMDVLKKNQVNAINISLDSLKPERFAMMTRRNAFNKVWEAINLLVAESFCQVKINCVVMKGFNDDEIVDFVKLTEDLPIHVRFIEFMPFHLNGWSRSKLFPRAAILDKIHSHFKNDIVPVGATDKTDCLGCAAGGRDGGSSRDGDGGGVSAGCSNNTADTIYRMSNGLGYIGIIASMTNMFCSTCSRIRLTADGNIKNCLFGRDEFSLRPLLRKTPHDWRPEEMADYGDMELELLEIVKKALYRKKKQHGGMDMLHATEQLNRPMVRIGG
eukprot:GHVS01091728.1.p1 GENE.GHVS01091728.1~~GHVS01091728.1.p1  ORF type:complete len:281 (-),score=32.04 GHVS01091728.1:178-1020(-)